MAIETKAVFWQNLLIIIFKNLLVLLLFRRN